MGQGGKVRGIGFCFPTCSLHWRRNASIPGDTFPARPGFWSIDLAAFLGQFRRESIAKPLFGRLDRRPRRCLALASFFAASDAVDLALRLLVLHSPLSGRPISSRFGGLLVRPRSSFRRPASFLRPASFRRRASSRRPAWLPAELRVVAGAGCFFSSFAWSGFSAGLSSARATSRNGDRRTSVELPDVFAAGIALAGSGFLGAAFGLVSSAGLASAAGLDSAGGCGRRRLRFRRSASSQPRASSRRPVSSRPRASSRPPASCRRRVSSRRRVSCRFLRFSFLFSGRFGGGVFRFLVRPFLLSLPSRNLLCRGRTFSGPSRIAA